MIDETSLLFAKQEKRDRKILQTLNGGAVRFRLLNNSAFWWMVFIFLVAAIAAGAIGA